MTNDLKNRLKRRIFEGISASSGWSLYVAYILGGTSYQQYYRTLADHSQKAQGASTLPRPPSSVRFIEHLVPVAPLHKQNPTEN
ncbi:unnamed protein product [Didymodactylos carnosus]|nr:unnamed protein product [Didymodactylos carnosus]CAF4081952.1 unnamed protein product [Didymodactylos carnosus]